MAEEKLFGKYSDFILVLLGFLLTGIIGTYIAQTYTTKNAELSASNKIFSEYSKLTGDRYFTMNQVMLSLRSGDDENILNMRWDAYRAELQKWNTSRGYNRVMIKLYFGQALWNQERDIHYFFRVWGQALESANKSRENVDFSCLENSRDDFLVRLNEFNYSIAEAIQEGNIGKSKSNLTAEETPPPAPPCLTKRSN